MENWRSFLRNYESSPLGVVMISIVRCSWVHTFFVLFFSCVLFNLILFYFYCFFTSSFLLFFSSFLYFFYSSSSFLFLLLFFFFFFFSFSFSFLFFFSCSNISKKLNCSGLQFYFNCFIKLSNQISSKNDFYWSRGHVVTKRRKKIT